MYFCIIVKYSRVATRRISLGFTLTTSCHSLNTRFCSLLSFSWIRISSFSSWPPRITLHNRQTLSITSSRSFQRMSNRFSLLRVMLGGSYALAM